MGAAQSARSIPVISFLILAAALLGPIDSLAASPDSAGPETDFRTQGVQVSLDEDALKEAMAVYWSGVINRMPPFKDGDRIELDPDAFKVLAKVPVQKGPNVYFAVKLGFKDAKSYYLAPPFPISMVVDPTGTLFFSKVIDIARSEEAILSRAPAVTRTSLPSDLKPTTIKVGAGKTDVILASDPFCGYCRRGYAYISAHMDRVLAFKVVHNILFDDEGSAVAAWMMEYARSKGADLAAVYDFSYTDLQPVSPETVDGEEQIKGEEQIGEEILDQYKEKFPSLFEETGGDVKAMYRLLAERYELETAGDRDELVKAQLSSTPFFVIDDEIIRGFDKSRLAEVLGIPPTEEPAAPARESDCADDGSGMCKD